MNTYQVDIAVEAYDRSGLLRDITSVLANDKINLIGVNTLTDKEDGIARMNLTIEITDISQLSRVLSQDRAVAECGRGTTQALGMKSNRRLLRRPIWTRNG